MTMFGRYSGFLYIKGIQKQLNHLAWKSELVQLLNKTINNQFAVPIFHGELTTQNTQT